MIGTLRKHSQALWWVIIVAIIITFVWWGSSSSQRGGTSGPDNFGILNGRKITRSAFAETQREVYLMYFFSSGGSWPDRAKNANFDVMRETYFRLLLIQKQEELGIHVSDDALAKLAADRLRSMNRGQPVSPAQFSKQVLEPQGLALVDFERYLRHELGVQQLASTVGVGGELLTPQEIRALYAREHQELSVQAAFFSASNQVNMMMPTTEQLTQFYSNQIPRYRLPDRLQVNYVKFALSNYFAEAKAELDLITNLNEIIDAKYQELGTNFFSEAKSPAEAKEKIREMALKENALVAARKKASEFATELFKIQPANAQQLVTFAGGKGITPAVSPAFSRAEPPAGLEVDAEFIKAAFALNEEEPYSQTIVGNDGVYLISLNKTLPSEVPSFESVRDQVTRDYRYVEAINQARRAAVDFVAKATNSLAAGKDFAAAAAAAGVKLSPVPPFSLSTRSLPSVEQHVGLSQFKQAAYSTAPGQLSQLQPSSDGAFVIFVQGKLPLDETKMAAELPQYEKVARQNRRSEAFNEWFRLEAEKTLRGIPYFQQPPPPAGQARS